MKSAKVFLFALIALFAFNLTACNTVEGFGKDVKKVGTKVGDKIEKAGDKD